MDRFIKISRLSFFAIIFSVLLILYCFTLYNLQVVQGEEYLRESTGSTSTTRTISASRGSIYDRNGTLLASDRVVYSVTISRSKLLEIEDSDERNNVIRVLTDGAIEYGVSYTDTLPITKTAPFEYDAGASSSQISFLNSYIAYFGDDLSEDMTAPDLISWLRDHYSISYTVPAEEARRIIGVRYEMELRAIVYTNDYVFAQDVPSEYITYISEQGFSCVDVEVTAEREYYTSYAAHVIGYVGPMGRDDYDNKYKELDYPLDATVGLSGAEKAFESYLRGTDGLVTTYTDADGAVTNVVTETEAQPGNNVYLTIDIALQEKTENILASAIAEINAERSATVEIDDDGNVIEPELVEAGAAVILDVNTGEVLAMASYPSFDLMTYSEDKGTLIYDESKPLWNRATSGIYNPGSTFKMVTAYAALTNGIIGPWTEIEDQGVFTKYEDVGYTPKCWIYPGNHGYLNVVGALENSCNYFFYYVADQMDIDQIAEAASEFGFGALTGIEIDESTGHLATREYKMEVTGEQGWWKADTLITSIGQGLNEFTPIQIANYVACIANGGTLNATTILKSIKTYDHSTTILENEPEVLNVVDNSDGYVGLLQQGMRAVARTGTAASYFTDYSIPVAAKTGTIQSDSTTVNNAVFVCYAPYDDPQVAIALVVEKGNSGSSIAPIARELLDAYFSTSNVTSYSTVDDALIR